MAATTPCRDDAGEFIMMSLYTFANPCQAFRASNEGIDKNISIVYML